MIPEQYQSPEADKPPHSQTEFAVEAGPGKLKSLVILSKPVLAQRNGQTHYGVNLWGNHFFNSITVKFLMKDMGVKDLRFCRVSHKKQRLVDAVAFVYYITETHYIFRKFLMFEK